MISSQDILSFFQSYYEQWGNQLVFVGALLENVFPVGYFIPGSTVVWLGAFYSYSGVRNIGEVFILGVLGAFLGHIVDYLIGRYGWYRIFKRFIKEDSFNRAKDYLKKNKYRDTTILYFIGYTRSLLIITMGAVRISFGRFLIFALLASIAWNLAFLGFGYFLGTQRYVLERGLNLFWVGGLLFTSFYLLPRILRKGNLS